MLVVETIAKIRRAFFVQKKPIKEIRLHRAIERDEALVQQWLKKEYPKIKAIARKEEAEIYFGDAAHIRYDGCLSPLACSNRVLIRMTFPAVLRFHAGLSSSRQNKMGGDHHLFSSEMAGGGPMTLTNESNS